MKLVTLSFVVSVALAALAVTGSAAEKKSMKAENPPIKNPPALTDRITFGGGCFWCLEAVFQRLAGVKSVASGYAGGPKANPTYQEVCAGSTGHAEVVQIEFDPSQTSFEKLLEVFWAAHDPTTLNRQGNDVGTQYRSVIYYENPEQKALAEKSKAAAQSQFKEPIVTEVTALKAFFKAEDYHQNYFNNNSSTNPYCSLVIGPKLLKLLQKGVIKEPAGR